MACSPDTNPVEQLINPDPVLPTADFSADITALETGASVNFADDSEHATSHEWTFEGGDPAISFTENVQVTYETAGTYSVSLKVTNDDGTDTETKVDFITVTDAPAPPLPSFQEIPPH